MHRQSTAYITSSHIPSKGRLTISIHIEADEAYVIGKRGQYTPVGAYLAADEIVKIALQHDVNMIHPGKSHIYWPAMEIPDGTDHVRLWLPLGKRRICTKGGEGGHDCKSLKIENQLKMIDMYETSSSAPPRKSSMPSETKSQPELSP